MCGDLVYSQEGNLCEKHADYYEDYDCRHWCDYVGSCDNTGVCIYDDEGDI